MLYLLYIEHDLGVYPGRQCIFFKYQESSHVGKDEVENFFSILNYALNIETGIAKN